METKLSGAWSFVWVFGRTLATVIGTDGSTRSQRMPNGHRPNDRSRRLCLQQNCKKNQNSKSWQSSNHWESIFAWEHFKLFVRLSDLEPFGQVFQIFSWKAKKNKRKSENCRQSFVADLWTFDSSQKMCDPCCPIPESCCMPIGPCCPPLCPPKVIWLMGCKSTEAPLKLMWKAEGCLGKSS